MIESSVSLGSLGGVVCQFLSVSGRQATISEVCEWITAKPWLIPCGRIAVEFEDVPILAQTAIMASLARINFYELIVHAGAGYITVASTDPQRIGTEYAPFPLREVVCSHARG